MGLAQGCTGPPRCDYIRCAHEVSLPLPPAGGEWISRRPDFHPQQSSAGHDRYGTDCLKGMMGRSTGSEPATSGTTNQRSNQLSYDRHRGVCPEREGAHMRPFDSRQAANCVHRTEKEKGGGNALPPPRCALSALRAREAVPRRSAALLKTFLPRRRSYLPSGAP